MKKITAIIKKRANWYFIVFIILTIPALLLGVINNYWIGNIRIENFCFLLIILGMVHAAQFIALVDLKDSIQESAAFE